MPSSNIVENLDYVFLEKQPHKLLVKNLINLNLKIAVAESLTGGLISKMITDIPGASKVFELGVCTYSNSSKIKILGIDPQKILQYSAVSKEIAVDMALGVQRLSGSNLAIGTTGYAGSKKEMLYNKDVGLVFFSIFFKNRVYVKKLNFKQLENKKSYSRSYIRTQTAIFALSAALALLKTN